MWTFVRRRRVLLVAVASIVAATAVPVLAAALSSGSNGTVGAAATTTTTTPPNLIAARVRLTQFATGLVSPVAVAFRRGDGRMYVAQQTGTVVIVANGHVVSTVLDISAAVSQGGEQGLLGLTFSLDGTKMYIDYTDLNGNSHIVEYTMAGDHPNLATRRPVLFQNQPFANHNGGEVMIGRDNMLYIGFGDGGSGGDPLGNGQKLTTLLGKILRIDPRPNGTAAYRIPPNNPFATATGGVRREIWMYGLRNPWRFSLDRITNDAWIGDVGQNLYEEVDFAAAGQSGINWGWNKREGLHPYLGGAKPAGARDPIVERPHTAGDCAITGGYVYRSGVIAHLNGAYVYGDFCTGELRAVVQVNGHVTQARDLGLNVPALSSFGQGPFGGIYAVSHSGTIYMLTPG